MMTHAHDDLLDRPPVNRPEETLVSPRGRTHDVPRGRAGLRIPQFRPVWTVTVLIGLALTAYSICFIYTSSCVVEGQRYFTLFDDALISMRYAWNWSQGNGPVWNPGERVEGYTNFGWLLIMTLLHLPGWSPSNTCLAVQILGIVILWLCLFAAVRLSRQIYPHPTIAIFAAVLVAFHYNLIYFSLMGVETALLCLLITLALTDACRALRRRTGGITTLFWFAPAVLVRLDVALPMLITALFLLATIRRGRLRVAISFGLMACVPLIHTLWRHSYYGDWLPNTYYLKATGWPLLERLKSGMDQSFWVGVTLGLPILLASLALLKPKRSYILLLTCFFGVLLYQTWIGGDAWHLNRFVIPYTIGLFVVAASGLERILALWINHRQCFQACLCRCFVVLLVILEMNAIHWKNILRLSPSQTVKGNLMNIRLWRGLERSMDRDASIAVAWAGLIPYFSERPSYDLLGKCDHYIARLPCTSGQTCPGHNKHDFTYSLNHYRPDVICHLYHPHLPVILTEYRPVVVDVDGKPVAFFIRKQCTCAKGVHEIDLARAGEIIRRDQQGAQLTEN